MILKKNPCLNGNPKALIDNLEIGKDKLVTSLLEKMGHFHQHLLHENLVSLNMIIDWRILFH